MSKKALSESIRSWLPGLGDNPSGLRPPSDTEGQPVFKVPPRFKLLGLLGSGGMGSVYRAHDSELAREVALKRLHDLTPEQNHRLRTEFRALANVVHPNLVELYELWADEEVSFFTMELIVGRDFCSYAQDILTKQPSGWDTFRDLSRQLVQGVVAIHASNQLHRDVKSPNVLVTEAGRVVLLDFGLVTALADGPSSSNAWAGTFQYMAPEVAWGETAEAASDWYSLGVTLYEAITGRLPFSGAPFQMLQQKREHEYPPIDVATTGVPESMAHLVHSLLDPDPSHRPNGDALLAYFQSGRGRSVAYPTNLLPAPSHRTHFVGRQSELARLHQVLNERERSEPRIVTVSGASGIGKSELMRQFSEETARGTKVLVVQGHCQPHETVPFNALDGVVEGLARFLKEAPTEDLVRLLPPDADALQRVFPVFSGVETVGRTSHTSIEERAALRRRAARALRTLLTEIARERPLVVWIDDAQWGDDDSGLFLKELFRRDAPPLMLVLSYRSGASAASPCLEALEDMPAIAPSWRYDISLEPLSQGESRQLVRKIIGESDENSTADSLVDDAGGLPFMLCELGGYLASYAQHERPTSAPQLAEIIERKLSGLPTSAWDILQVYALARGPLHPDVALSAIGKANERHVLLTLEKLGLIRTVSVEVGDAQIYHDRICTYIVERLGDDLRRERHRQLAEAMLLQPIVPLTQVVEHYLEAEDAATAKRYIVPAARAADAAFAFDQAARLYQKAIDLGCSDVSQPELHTRLGQALMSSGRAHRAALAFQSAASLVESQATHDRQHVLSLRQKAAELFLQSGYNAEAAESLTMVLNEFGLPMPKTRQEAVRRATLLRFRQALTPLQQVPSKRDAMAKARGEALWAVTMRLGLIDHARMGLFAAEGVQYARRSGDRSAISRAYATEAGFTALYPLDYFQKRSDRMLEIAAELCDSKSIIDSAHLAWGRGAVAWLRCDWKTATKHFDTQLETLRKSHQRLTFDMALCEIWRLSAVAFLGDLDRLRSRLSEIAEEADQLADRYMGRVSRLGEQTIVWLADDRAGHAIQLADDTLPWMPPEYSTPHYHHYLATAQALIYQGKGRDAWQRTEIEWPKLKSALLLSCNGVRDELAQLRARCALAAAEETQAGAEHARSRASSLLREARRLANTIAHHRVACGAGWSALILAGVERLEGRQERCLEQLERAAREFADQEMRLYELSARCAQQLVAGSSADHPLAQLSAAGVKNPRAMVRLLAPGCVPTTSG